MSYDSVLSCAVSQIGQGNDPDGSNKYSLWYWGYRSTAPWCAVFITWCFNEVGILDRLNGLTNKAGCEPWRRWAVSKGIFGTTPKPGAIVLYDWNPKTGDGADHIGIVESVTGNGIIAIEGNTSVSGSQSNGGKVLRKTRYRSDIMGYVYVDTRAKRPTPSPVIGFERIAGYDRYKTSELTADETTFSECVVASGKNFADALSASFFAGQKGVPVVLTSPDVYRNTSKYLAGKGVKKIYIVGGEAVVPKELEQGRDAVRFSGANRYETNDAVLRACETPSKQLLVVNGGNFADAICAGTIDRPLMLTGKKLKDYQRDYIIERGFSAFYVIGGQTHPDVLEELKNLGEVSIFAGRDRYETSAIVGKKFFPQAKEVAITTGRAFPDGISARNIGRLPVILADTNHTDHARSYIRTLSLERAFAVGGTIPTETVNWALTK